MIVIDTKGELRWNGYTITSDPNVALDHHNKHTIFRPNGDLRAVEKVFAQAYKEKGWTIYVDEIYMLGIGSVHRFPPSFIRCLTAGRSRSVSVFVATQRPRFLPLFAMTEPYHVFVFRLGSVNDHTYLMKMVGVENAVTRPKGHDFLYYDSEQEDLHRSRLNLN